MKQSRQRLGLSVLLGCAIVVGLSKIAIAQSNITPDSTLGSERSIRIDNFLGLPVEVISGGVTRENNLFHSFEAFNIETGRGAFFLVPSSTIQNVLARVTGTNRSQISGTLGTFQIVNGAIVDSSANLFLINPNGILFTEQAQLSLGGSFVATTSNALGFRDQGVFSATNPSSPELLTVTPSALFFNQSSRNPIDVNQSRLSVNENQNLLMVGGNITLNGAALESIAGRIELGGLTAPGTVELLKIGNQFNLTFPENVARGDVKLLNGSAVVTAGIDRGGSIAIHSRNLELSGLSTLFTGTVLGGSNIGNQDERVSINTTDTLSATESSIIRTGLFRGAVGVGGNIDIVARSLFLSGGSQISTSTFGTGNAGNITVKADTIALDGEVQGGGASGILSAVRAGAIGDGGIIDIRAQTVSLTNGAQINAATRGIGNGGMVQIEAETLIFSGVGINDRSSGIRTDVDPLAIGNGGTIKITAGSLLMNDGARLNAVTRGTGNAGNVFVQARDSVVFDGQSLAGDISGISTQVSPGAVGNAGQIDLTARSLFAGNGALISATTFGQGTGGNVNIRAHDTAIFDGVGLNGLSTVAGSQVGTDAVGSGGNLSITAGTLIVRNGAQLGTGTFADGNAGKISVNADRVFLDGIGTNGGNSGIFSNVERGALGGGGEIQIKANQFSITNGAAVASNSFSIGRAGDIQITTDSLTLDRQGGITSGTTIAGGGNISLNVQNILTLRRNSKISTTAGFNFDDLLFSLLLLAFRGVSATIQPGDGGNLSITAPFIVSAPFENSDISANSATGRGGKVIIDALGLYWIAPRSRTQLTELLGTETLDPQRLLTNDITAISQENPILDGVVSVTTPDVDPSRGLIALPTNLVDRANQIVQDCTPRSQRTASSFINTGRGGIPPSPADTLGSISESASWINAEVQGSNSALNRAAQPQKSIEPIVEMHGWVKDQNGDIYLVAYTPNSKPHQFRTLNCF